MTIGINGNEANVAHRVGVGQYAFELLTNFTNSRLPVTVYLANPPLPDMPKLHYKVLPGKGLWTLTTLQKELVRTKNKPDVFFTPTHYAPLYLPMPSVISIMDMSFERFPQYFKKKDLFQLKYWTWLSAHQAKKILTISEFSKKEICDIYGFPRDKVVVTYPGYDAKRFNARIKNQESRIREIGKKYKIYNSYILYIGTLQPRKNVIRLVEAFSLLTDNHYTLVIAGMISEGRGGWMHEDVFAKVEKLGLKDRIVFTGYVPDSDLPYLLSGSQVYVLPSLYEGFGIPAIEAMATGVPVVVSRVSSLPEVCGEAAIYIDDPTSVTSIKASLEKVLGLTLAERQKRIDLGLGWVKRYNWQKTAKQVLKVLYEVAKR